MHCVERGPPCSVILFDLDNFKTVNDSLGHNIGDELLKVVAFRLSNFLRDEDTAARLGGDEFAVLLSSNDQAEQALEIAQCLTEVLTEVLDFSHIEVFIGASAGVAMSHSGIDADVMLRNAVVAMYNAKRSSKGNAQVFDDDMFNDATELEIKRDLPRCTDNEELQLFIQPLLICKMALHSGSKHCFDGFTRNEVSYLQTNSFRSPRKMASFAGLAYGLSTWL